MTPTIGRIVLYTLTEDDAQQINRRRTTGAEIAKRMEPFVVSTPGAPSQIKLWPAGAQAHIGNDAHAGDIYPMIVTRVWSPGMVNGQVLLDGNDCLWATSVLEGTGERTWMWPPRV